MSTKEAQTQELITALEHERQINLQLKTELASVKQSQHEFISLVAHELRIPMTAIQGYTDLLIKAVMGPVNDTQLRFCRLFAPMWNVCHAWSQTFRMSTRSPETVCS